MLVVVLKLEIYLVCIQWIILGLCVLKNVFAPEKSVRCIEWYACLLVTEKGEQERGKHRGRELCRANVVSWRFWQFAAVESTI